MAWWNNIHINRLQKRIFMLAWVSMNGMQALAQENGQTQALMPGEAPKPTKYVAVEEQKQHLVFFQGFTLSVDAYGPVAYMVSDYGTAEGALRLNLKNTYFPIFEAGAGRCSKEDYNTHVTYKANAPYARVGIDFNMLKNKFQDNRLYLGARYGFSVFKYEIGGPAMTDPIWGGCEPFHFKGIDCTSHWAELVVGAEVKIFKNFHMGWAIRYKMEISSTKSDYAKPACIPGYGYTTDSSCWGGTYSLIFDLNWGLKKSHKRGVNMEIREIGTGGEQETNNNEQDIQEGNDNGEPTTDNGTTDDEEGTEGEEPEGEEPEASI